MNTSAQLAKHLREIHFGGNWTCSSMKEQLQDISWQLATKKVYSFNTIATLVYHTSYYVTTVSAVLRGEALNSSDEMSFKHPPINSEKDWNEMLEKVWANAEDFAVLIEQLPDERLWEDFTDKKYGIYFRNLLGIIEHMHYHLGQIALLKKLLRETTGDVRN